MLHMLKNLEGLRINTTEGNTGKTEDFYFDDKEWVIRYLVIDVGTLLNSKKVLLSPMSIKDVNTESKTITVSISTEKMKNSPDIDTQKPVSRQYEADYLGYFGYPSYWGSKGLWGSYSSPYLIAAEVADIADGQDTPDMYANIEAMRYRDQDLHIRSCDKVKGYHIKATDGDLGHLDGMLVDTYTWAIKYLIINTSNWWLGHCVLIAPKQIKEVTWLGSMIYVDMTQKQVKEAPLFDPDIPFSHEQENELHLKRGRNIHTRY